MIKHIWSVICSKSSVDRETNNVSLFEVLEQLSFNIEGPDIEKARNAAADNHVALPFNFELVTLLERDSSQGEPGAEIKAGIAGPDGKMLGSFSHAFHFIEGKRRMRIVIKNTAIPLSKSGIYRFMVMLKEQGANEHKLVAEIPLEIAVDFK